MLVCKRIGVYAFNLGNVLSCNLCKLFFYCISIPKNLSKTYRRAPEKDEKQIIFENVDKPFGFFALFVMLTGLRKGEALALQYSDIDFDNKLINVTKSVYYDI